MDPIVFPIALLVTSSAVRLRQRRPRAAQLEISLIERDLYRRTVLRQADQSMRKILDEAEHRNRRQQG